MKGLKLKYVKNVKKPTSLLGRLQLLSMNKRHAPLADWGITNVDFAGKTAVLDVGCGGGENLRKMIKILPAANFCGADYSMQSVKMTAHKNRKAIKAKKLKTVCTSVEKMPFAENSFDLVTAFETVYFWNIPVAFGEVYRVLKGGGQFAIVNEAYRREGMEEYMNDVGFDVYPAEELTLALEKAGFCNIKTYFSDNGKWITVTAGK